MLAIGDIVEIWYDKTAVDRDNAARKLKGMEPGPFQYAAKVGTILETRQTATGNSYLVNTRPEKFPNVPEMERPRVIPELHPVYAPTPEEGSQPDGTRADVGWKNGEMLRLRKK